MDVWRNVLLAIIFIGLLGIVIVLARIARSLEAIASTCGG